LNLGVLEQKSRYVPAAGRAGLTRFYDLGVRLTMREPLWRPAVVEAVVDVDPVVVVDIGCGTGTTAIAIADVLPGSRIVGIDGDPAVLSLAQAKPGADQIEWIESLADSIPLEDDETDVVVSSLVLHHLPLASKRAMLGEARRVLRPGGRLIVADWAAPQDLVASAGFLALQVLDGFATTNDNRRGLIPTLIEEAGFATPQRAERVRTALGTFDVLVSD
jgi:ubiquinone/menaquinone biosynthesis C-methylase UbiE